MADKSTERRRSVKEVEGRISEIEIRIKELSERVVQLDQRLQKMADVLALYRAQQG
jgi:uncharacterized coiled-coil protein SlyX